MIPSRPGLLAFDLDGTVLDESGEVTTRTAEALRALAARGWRIVPATGRPAFMIAGVCEVVGPDVAYGIASNGSEICSLPDCSTLFAAHFGVETAAEAVRRVRESYRDVIFAFATDRGFAQEHGFDKRMPARNGRVEVDDVLAVGGSVAYKLIAVHATHGAHWLLDTLTPLVGHNLDVSHVGAEGVEIGPKGIDKASGLVWLCDHLGVAQADVVAIGDNINDLTMLRWAGHGVAMGNADPHTKAAADQIIGPNTAEGLAHFVEAALLS